MKRPVFLIHHNLLDHDSSNCGMRTTTGTKSNLRKGKEV